MNVAYVRVSTMGQNEKRQLKALESYGIDRWFIDKMTGITADRPNLRKMLNYVRSGDIVYIHDLSRLGRNLSDLLKIITILNDKEVLLVSNKEEIDTSTALGKLMVTMVGVIAEFEHDNLLERQREGIAIAKEQGKYKGRKAKEINSEFIKLYKKYIKKELNKVQFAKELSVSRPTLDKLISKYETEIL